MSQGHSPTDRAAHLAAIRAAPDDDAPRLVYADWLDEHGQPDRAELIRVQVELGAIQRLVREKGERAGPAAALINRLADREHELLSTGRVFDWLGDWHWNFYSGSPAVHHQGGGRCLLYFGLPLIPRLTVTFARGFLSAVTCPAREGLACLDEILSGHPVREVRLTTRPEYLSTVAGRDANGTLIAVEGPQPDDATILADLKRRWDGITFHLPRWTAGNE